MRWSIINKKIFYRGEEWMFGLFKVILSILLIVGIISPELVWTISEGWKFRDAEPSEAYLVMTRVMSVIMLFVIWFIVRL